MQLPLNGSEMRKKGGIQVNFAYSGTLTRL
jgi:hypothetical protein